MIDYWEENKGFLVFLAMIFIVLILVSINIFLPIPVEIKRVSAVFTTVLSIGSVFYFVGWAVLSMWEMPELEAWEWILLIGILGTLILVFFFMAIGAEGINLVNIASEGMGM